MSGLRLKGLECAIVFVGPDGPETSITKFPSFEINILGEILTEEYVDEDAPDFDDVSMGVEIKAKVHFNDPSVFKMIERIENRRRRIGSAVGKFSTGGRFAFPDGGVRRIVVPNIFFGDFPIGVSGRKAYVGTDITAKAKRAFFKGG